MRGIRRVDIFVHMPLRGERGRAKLIFFSPQRPGGFTGGGLDRMSAEVGATERGLVRFYTAALVDLWKYSGWKVAGASRARPLREAPRLSHLLS